MFQLVQDVKGDQELADFACKVQSEYDMYDQPQYKIFLIPDLSPEKSALVIKVHHNMSDGLGIATFF